MEMIRAPKQRGEWVEAQFLARAAAEGLTVSKPWGESARYDFIVEHKGALRRVQVKSTTARDGDAYKCRCTPFIGTPYSADDIDFIAAHVVPQDAWYILPISAVAGQLWVRLAPTRKDNKYRRYLERWDLLR